MRWIALFLVCFLPITKSFTWNAAGHRVIAQIAYKDLPLKTKKALNRYNQAFHTHHQSRYLVDAAVWLDTLRSKESYPYGRLHYIDLTFSEDGSPLPLIDADNAVSAIKTSVATLQNKSANAREKGLALRILLHVVGDIHQPMHTVSRVSHAHPEGDRGGNQFILAKNPIARNLHVYWDVGGGYLSGKNRRAYQDMARNLAVEFPCSQFSLNLDAASWAKESHNIGVDAYHALYHNRVDSEYQVRTIKIVKRQLALAGCRLGALLTQVS